MFFRIIVLLFLSPALIAASYSDHYDKEGSGSNYSEHYDKTDKPDVDGSRYYEKHTETATPPSDVLKNEPTDYRQLGKNLGASVTNKTNSEDALRKNLMDPLQSSSDMTTFGSTYVCEADNNTYSDTAECKANCASFCKDFYFKPEVSCQTVKEVASVTPSHIGENPELKISFNSRTFTTLPVTAICINGYMSNGYIFEWIVKDGEFGAINTGGDKSTTGECEDLRGKTLFAYPRNYYDYLGYALASHLSKIGYVTSSPEIKNVKGGMVGLTVSAIVSGACKEGALNASIPNADIINGGNDSSSKIDINKAKDIAKDDPTYKALTSNNSFSMFSCSITNRAVYGEGKLNIKFEDGCKVVKPSCTLVNEAVCDMNNSSCVNRVSSKLPTKSYIPKMCNEYMVDSSKHSICADGNRITVAGSIFNFQLTGSGQLTVNRDYECIEGDKEEYDYSDFANQSSMINQSANLSEDGTYTYQYKDQDGKVQTSTSKQNMVKEECVQSCRVKVPANIASDNKTILTSDGKPAPRLIDPVMYKTCTMKSKDWVCELENGETMIQDCDCPNDFVDTIVKLKSVEEISKNMKCTVR